MARLIKELRYKSEVFVKNSDIVYICPHLEMDVDALASALGFYMLANKYKRKAYIVLDDNVVRFENSVKSIMNELPNEIKFMDKTKAENILNSGQQVLLVMVDTNKSNLVPFDDFSKFKDIMIIDHHQTDDFTVDADYSFIDLDSSSTSEIMYQLLNAHQIKLDGRNKEEPILIPNIANYLLGGIVLDTDFFRKGASSNTTDVATKLQLDGATFAYVTELFSNNYNTDMRVQNLVGQTAWKSFNFGISYNSAAPNTIYHREDLAKAADWLLKYRGTDAAFVLGFVKERLVYISARSKGVIDVGEIMSQLGGGGTKINAAAAIESDDIMEVKESLDEVIKPGYNLSKIEKPKQLLLTARKPK